MSLPGQRMLLVGVGGQGVLTAAKLLGDAAVMGDVPVRVTQLHGMSQRGGSVEAEVLAGGPVELHDDADILVGFEPIEAVRAIGRVSGRTTVIVSRGRVTPFTLTFSGQPYPDLETLLGALLDRASGVIFVDGKALVREVEDPRCLGLVLLGTLSASGRSVIGRAEIVRALERAAGPVRVHKWRRAFELGEERAQIRPKNGGRTA